MINISRKNISLLALLVTLLVYGFFYCAKNSFSINYDSYQDNKKKCETHFLNRIEQNKQQIKQAEEKWNEYQTEKQEQENQNKGWCIEIPKIELIAQIAEGTTEEIMNVSVGHFEETSLWNGNVGLAAHNRGYPVNYFGRIKELQKGDLIIYYTSQGKRTYEVQEVLIIQDIDWSYLEKTQENKITLITCVEDKPELRRCVQGIEKKEEEKNEINF